MNENWKLWRACAQRASESVLRRYALAVVLVLLAAFLTAKRPALSETPFFPFLGAVMLTALCAGLGPAFITTALSSLVIRFLFVKPHFSFDYGSNTEGMERMLFFFLVALMSSSLIAALRRECHLLRDSEERYRILAETASDAIVVIDEQGVIRFANPGAERIFGSPATQMLGRDFSMLLPEQFTEPRLTELKGQLDSRKKSVAVEWPVQLECGRKMWLEMTFGAFSKSGKNLFTAIIRDISGRYQPDQVPS